MDNLGAPHWEWRRVYTGMECDASGNAAITMQEPEFAQGYFVALSAGDMDGDGLTDGYEAWFNYNGLHTVIDNFDSDDDKMPDNWEVEYGLNPTVATGNDGGSGNPDGDSYPNLTEYYDYSVFDGSYDPLKVYNTAANRPVVSISSYLYGQSCDQASFTISRYGGIAASYSNPLTVYYAVGGTLSYDNGDYTLNPTPTEWPRIYSATIPEADPGHGVDGHSVTVTIDAPHVATQEGDSETVTVSLTPYAVSPQPQVQDAGSWAYVVDWYLNRATLYFTYDSERPTVNSENHVTDLTRAVNMTLTGSGCSLPLSFSVDSQPTLGVLSGTPPNLTYTPTTAGQGDYFQFTATDADGRQSVQGTISIDVLPGPTLTASGDCSSVGLQWTIPAWVDQYVEDFEVYRSTTPGGEYPGTPIATLPATSRSYSDSDASGQTYYVVTFHYTDPFDLTRHESPSSEVSVSPRTAPVIGPMDVVFIVDNTDSMNGELLANLQNRIDYILDCIQASSGNDYRLALLTPDEDQVDVRVPFAQNNWAAFQNGLNAVTGSSGVGKPESTDECLDTAINALMAAGRTNPRNCTPRSSPLQIGDFTPGFSNNVVKLVVMITDAPPGGFCDEEDNGAKAHQYAIEAYGNCIKINAILVETSDGVVDSSAQTVMQDYEHTACGWYSQVPHDGGDIVSAVLKMIYDNSYCNCQ